MDCAVMADDDGRHGFDFLLGTWEIRHRRLTRRLAGATDWEEFASSARVTPLLDGLGLVDAYEFPVVPGIGRMSAMTLRLYDPATRVWTTWWATTLAPGRLDPPVAGRVQDGCVRLFGDDEHEGRPVRVRFEYRPAADGRAVRWEQAFSADGGQSWETNWIMDWERTGDPPG